MEAQEFFSGQKTRLVLRANELLISFERYKQGVSICSELHSRSCSEITVTKYIAQSLEANYRRDIYSRENSDLNAQKPNK